MSRFSFPWCPKLSISDLQTQHIILWYSSHWLKSLDCEDSIFTIIINIIFLLIKLLIDPSLPCVDSSTLIRFLFLFSICIWLYSSLYKGIWQLKTLKQPRGVLGIYAKSVHVYVAEHGNMKGVNKTIWASKEPRIHVCILWLTAWKIKFVSTEPNVLT